MDNEKEFNYEINQQKKDLEKPRSSDIIINPSDSAIYNMNKNKNKDKLIFFNFLMYNTKLEVHLEELQSYLYWVGLIEYAVWAVVLALFISSPKDFGIIWLFVYHIARATIGMFILKNIPKTHFIIENLQSYENSSLEDIQKMMEHNYVTLIHDNERILKPLLITYMILTAVGLIVDFVVFAVVASKFSQKGVSEKVFALLIAISVFIGEKNLIF
jgi:hypothetical protein